MDEALQAVEPAVEANVTEPTATECQANLTGAQALVADLDVRLDRLEAASRPKPRPHIPGVGLIIGD